MPITRAPGRRPGPWGTSWTGTGRKIVERPGPPCSSASSSTLELSPSRRPVPSVRKLHRRAGADKSRLVQPPGTGGELNAQHGGGRQSQSNTTKSRTGTVEEQGDGGDARADRRGRGHADGPGDHEPRSRRTSSATAFACSATRWRCRSGSMIKHFRSEFEDHIAAARERRQLEEGGRGVLGR